MSNVAELVFEDGDVENDDDDDDDDNDVQPQAAAVDYSDDESSDEPVNNDPEWSTTVKPVHHKSGNISVCCGMHFFAKIC